MVEEKEEQLGLAQEDLSWEPHEAYSGPGESSDESDTPAARRGPGPGRSSGPGLPRKRQQRPEWTRHEEEVFVRQHCIRGNSWSAIAEHLPGRTAAEVKNIWHSTLRSKHLKSRSLLRAYVLEVQERGDSPEAREEAFRAARLQTSSDDAGIDTGDVENNGHGDARASPSPDRNVERPAGASSPRLLLHGPKRFADTARVGRPKNRPAGSSGVEDATSLGSDLSPPPPPQPPPPPSSRPVMLRTNHVSSSQHRRSPVPGGEARRGDAGHFSSHRNAAAAGCESHYSHLQDFLGGGDSVTNMALINHRVRGSHRCHPGDPDGLDPGSDVDAATVALACIRNSGGSGGGGLMPPRGAPLQPVMWQLQQQPQLQQQQQQRHWLLPSGGDTHVKRQRKELQLAEEALPRPQQQHQQHTGGRGIWAKKEEDGDMDQGRHRDGSEAAWRGGIVDARGDAHPPLTDGPVSLNISSPEELAHLQVLRILQSAGEQGQRGMQDMAAGPAGWLMQRLPAPLAQMLAEWQLLIQAKTNMEAEEAHRLAALRHYLTTQLQEARHMDIGAAASAVAALLAAVEENVSSNANGAWRLAMTEGATGGRGGPPQHQRNVASMGLPFQASSRRAPPPSPPPPPPAITGPAGTEDPYDRGGLLPLLTHGMVDSLTPHAGKVGSPPAAAGFNPLVLIAPQQQVTASLKHLGTLLGGHSGAAERLLVPHGTAPTGGPGGPAPLVPQHAVAAALEAAMAAGWVPGLHHPAAGGGEGPWEVQGGGRMDEKDTGVAMGSDIPSKVSPPTPDETPHANGLVSGSRPTTFSPYMADGEPGRTVRTSVKRGRMDLLDHCALLPGSLGAVNTANTATTNNNNTTTTNNNINSDYNGPFTHSQPANGALKLIQGVSPPFTNGRRSNNGLGTSLYGPYSQYSKNPLPSWADGNGAGGSAAVLRGVPTFGGFGATAGTRGPCADGPALTERTSGRQWNVEEVRQQRDGVNGQKARHGRRQQQPHDGGDDNQEENQQQQHQQRQQLQAQRQPRQPRQEQQQLHRGAQQRSRSRDGGDCPPGDHGLGVDASESDVAKALLSFSQLKPRQVEQVQQARGKLPGSRG